MANKKQLIKYGKLRDYAISMGISMGKLAKIVDMSESQLYYIDRFDNPEIRLSTIVKIYNGTKEEFGVGLKPYQYLKDFNKEVFD